jgi:predicted nuclease of restriction endonuclease-like RecB superfamily
LLRKELLNFSLRDGLLVPRFLDTRDLPWIRRMLDEVERHAGAREIELQRRLRAPMEEHQHPRKQRLVAEVLYRLVTTTPRGMDGRQVRARLFSAAAASPGPADQVIDTVATDLAVSPPELMEHLFGDLPGQRLVVVPLPMPSPEEIALRANLRLARGLVERARVVSIELEGNARAIVRQAKLRRLICGVRPRSADGVALDISGPFALFRHTLVYGRALAELIPLLAWCRRFRLRADCVLGERSHVLQLSSGDPIFPSKEPRRFDSKVEERFFRDFGKLARSWEVIREPQPVVAGDWLLFPDFALQHREHPDRRWTVELVGFWTERYLERKLAAYRTARIENLILCVADDLRCGDAELPVTAQVLRYRRFVDARAVLGIVERERAAAAHA